MTSLTRVIVLVMASSILFVHCYATKSVCARQREVFTECERNMQMAYVTHGLNKDDLCRDMYTYHTCMHDTYVMCPDFIIFKDTTLHEAVRNLEEQYYRVCLDKRLP